MSESPPRWSQVDRWLQLQYGMSEEKVLELLGPPTTATQSGRKARRYRYGVVRESGNELRSCGWVDFDGQPQKGFRLTKWSAPDLAELEPPSAERPEPAGEA